MILNRIKPATAACVTVMPGIFRINARANMIPMISTASKPTRRPITCDSEPAWDLSRKKEGVSAAYTIGTGAYD